MLTLPKMICSARNMVPNEGELQGICVYCGEYTEHGHKFKPTGQFTTYQHIQGGTCICEYCNEMKSSQDYRRSMWAANPKTFITFKPDTAKEILCNPPEPPFVMYFTKTWKKQGWPQLVNRVNYSKEKFIVGYDYDLVLVASRKRDEYLKFAQELLDRGLVKTELLTGHLKTRSYEKLDFDFNTIKKISFLCTDPLWNLCVYVSRKNNDKRNT
jgi:hypothetical protein